MKQEKKRFPLRRWRKKKKQKSLMPRRLLAEGGTIGAEETITEETDGDKN